MKGFDLQMLTTVHMMYTMVQKLTKTFFFFERSQYFYSTIELYKCESK